ncbi:hypothetical protein CN386_11980 [Bacillus cereus]|nr:hypothetical protein CN386_11980 [Bacillus cereus]PGT50508.1 hypothetical protein COD14_31195 [Bacillus cereus]PGV88968.1 hypothetical protein COD86_28775 [Bacillus cereus]
MKVSFKEIIKLTIKKDIKSIETWSVLFIFFFITLFSLKQFDHANFFMYIKVFSVYMFVFILFYLFKCYRIWKKQNNV